MIFAAPTRVNSKDNLKQRSEHSTHSLHLVAHGFERWRLAWTLLGLALQALFTGKACLRFNKNRL